MGKVIKKLTFGKANVLLFSSSTSVEMFFVDATILFCGYFKKEL
jgi:hypothetical protein